MSKIKEAGALAGAPGLQKVKASQGNIDFLNNTETHPEVQIEMLAVASVMRRGGVSFHHALTVCRLNGLGGQHA